MQGSLPIQDWLPAGPLREMGTQYVNRLPDVAGRPPGPEALLDQASPSWSDYLAAYALLYPGAVIVLALLGGLGMWGLFRWYRKREYAHRITCRGCGTVMLPCGLYCPGCGRPNPSPRALNWLGYARLGRIVPPAGRERHTQALRSFRRCFYCGEFLSEPTLDQQCPSCGHAVLKGAASVTEYDSYIARRRKWTYAAVVVLGIIPVLGPLLASSLYKRTLVNPYALYMTAVRESFMVAVLLLCRHVFRLLPFIGMPVLCLAEYHLYRSMFLWKVKALRAGPETRH